MKIVSFTVLHLLFIFNSNAAILKGVVKDKADAKLMPYVNYYINSDKNIEHKQGICNEKGYFEISIEQDDLPIHLTFKMIGYQTKELIVNNFTPLTIYLEQTAITIKQVEVSTYSAKSILSYSLQQFQQSLYNKPFNYEVFYQKNQTDIKHKFLYSTEYYSNIYQQLGEGPGIVNMKTRFLSSDSKYYQKALDEGLWEIRSMLSFELYTSSLKSPSIGIINTKNLNNLNLKVIGEITLDNEDYYKISYTSDTTGEDYRYGLLFVNMKDYGILYFSSNLMVNHKLKLEKEYFYSKMNNKYFLNHINGIFYNTDHTIVKTILFVNKQEFQKVQIINNNTKNIIGTSFKKEQHFEPDSSFWKGVSYIPSAEK